MNFGTAKEIITPEYPIKLACTGVFDKPYKSVNDDIYVRCLVMDDGNEKCMLMSYDLLFHDRELNEHLSSYAYEKYGVKPSSVVVSYTHAHTAPAVKGYNPGHHDDEYEKYLIRQGKVCIDNAMSSMFEGTLCYVSCDANYNIGRRKKIKGKVECLPDFETVVDKELFLICIKDLFGNIRSIITCYACHPVFYPFKDALSGEFPARVCKILDDKYNNCTSLYFQSAAGDVRPLPTVMQDINGENVWNRNMSFDAIDSFATDICEDIIKLIETQKMDSEKLSVASDSFRVKLDINIKKYDDFKKAFSEMQIDKDNPEYVNAELICNGGYEELSDYLMLNCSSLKITDNLYIATMGGEPCYGVKKIVKNAFEGKKLCFIGYTDSCAYIVDDTILNDGGYEPASFLEYGLKGPFKNGLDSKYFNGFKDSLARISK